MYKHLESFRLDYYKIRAMEMFHKSYGQITEEERNTAKEFIYSFRFTAFDPGVREVVLDSTIKILN